MKEFKGRGKQGGRKKGYASFFIFIMFFSFPFSIDKTMSECAGVDTEG